MIISLLNVHITIQKSTVVTDSIGNHKNGWENYYSCFATVSDKSGTEKEIAGQTVENTDITFTIRSCEKALAITAGNFRILLNGELYNILSVDHMNYTGKSVRFRCQKVRR